jgi:hypothetical protein
MVMVDVIRDAALDDDARRERLYAGDVFLYSPRASSLALCDLGRALLEEAFAPHDPRFIHHHLKAEETAAILSKVKPTFIHHPRCKELIPEILASIGCDPELVYFDVPRMRSAYPSDYLTSGIAYAFHPHRDTWYSAPHCQINWWLPIYPITSENGLAFYPDYFGRPIANNSEVYNYYRWNAASRATAAQHVRTDTRVQPKPQEPVEGPTINPLPDPGGMILFSGAQLHATIENTSGVARYSIDFRTVHRLDAKKRGGAQNVDSRCTGSAIRDYLRACDLTRLPADVVEEYNDGTELNEGPLIYNS